MTIPAYTACGAFNTFWTKKELRVALHFHGSFQNSGPQNTGAEISICNLHTRTSWKNLAAIFS
jgi:hypothetical protein